MGMKCEKSKLFEANQRRNRLKLPTSQFLKLDADRQTLAKALPRAGRQRPGFGPLAVRLELLDEVLNL